MASVKWIKLNVDMFDDEKIKIIQAMPDGDAILVIWIKLITLAGKTNDGGYIYISDNIPYTEEMLSIIMNKPIMTVKLAMETFAKLHMIENDTKGIYLVNFEKHQSLDRMQEIREYNRIAQRKSREKRKALALAAAPVNDSSMTGQSGHETDIDKDIDKEEDIEGDNNINTESVPDDIESLTKQLSEMYNCKEEKEEPDVIPYASIVAYLNQKAGTKYKATSDKTKTAIRARFAEGFTEENFRTVIDNKCYEWMGTEWEKYLRPSTLFGTKFEEYLNAKAVRKAETPKSYGTRTAEEINAGYCFDANEDSLDDLF